MTLWRLFVSATDDSRLSFSLIAQQAGSICIMPKREPRVLGSLTRLLMAESLFHPCPALLKSFLVVAEKLQNRKLNFLRP